MIFIDYPGHFIAVLIGIVLAGLFYLSFRSPKLASQGYKKYLFLLFQIIAVLILILILWNPSKPVMDNRDSKNTVYVFFDTSESMSIADEKKDSRLNLALKAFEKHFNLYGPTSPYYKIYGFDTDCYYAGSVESLHPKGELTNLHSVFSLLEKNSVSQSQLKRDENNPLQGKTVGAIVFTDGQSENKQVNAYLPLSNKDLQVYIIGTGSEKCNIDISVTKLEHPTRVNIDTNYEVEVSVSSTDYLNKPIEVEFLLDKQVIAIKKIELNSLFLSKIVKFTIPAKTLGVQSITARASINEMENNISNNERSGVVEVIENDKLKTLYYSQVAGFDIGKVRQALERDSKIQLDFGFDAIINPALAEKAKTMCGHVPLPENLSGFSQYDLVILGPSSVDKFSQEQLDGLYHYVVDRGGGLIILPGKEEYSVSNWKSEKAKILIPVLFNSNTNNIAAYRAEKIEPCKEAAKDNIINFEGIEKSDLTAALYYPDVIKKPAGTILASVNNTALISAHRVGRGRVCLLNIFRMYELYREDLQGGLLQRILSDVTSYVSRVTSLETGVELFAERLIDQPDSIKFSSYVCDASFSPVSGATVLLTVGNKVIRMDETGNGYYSVEQTGISAESIIATVQAECNGIFLGKKTKAVNLPIVRKEMDDVQLDARFLRDLSKRINAKYYHVDDVKSSIEESFEAITPISSVREMKSVWPRWWLMLILFLVLSINWFIKRSIGLV
jgi:hypothetical protein